MDDFDTPRAEDFNEDDMNFGGNDSRVMKDGEEKDIGKEYLKKKLVKEGECWDIPEKGDEVEVHYTGTLLDGTKFDSSHDRGSHEPKQASNRLRRD